MRLRRTAAVAASLAALLVLAYLALASRTDTYLGRWFAWKASDADDHLRFPSALVRNAPPASPLRGAAAAVDPGPIAGGAFDAFLATTGTTAFIAVHRGDVVIERYFNGGARDAVVTSFSVAKSITALLVGIAIDAGHFGSVDDPITRYLPELAARDARFGAISLAHLLDMRSGLAFADHDLPWGDKPRAYYHPELRRIAPEVPIVAPPGVAFVYNTFNPILVGMALERATGRTVAQFTEERLWQPLGAEYAASWSLDSDASAMAKMESGFNARAIDFARLGRLVLERGRVGGRTIVSAGWIDASLAIAPHTRVPGIAAPVHYQRGWWIHAPDATQRHAVAAWGHLGQYVYVFPDLDLVMVRFGTGLGDVESWPRVFQTIADRIAVQRR